MQAATPLTQAFSWGFMIRRASCVLLLCLSTAASAQLERIQAVRMAKPPVIDGVVDEAGEWKSVPSFEGLMDQKSAAAPVGARMWLAYDDHYVYFAAKLEDPQPQTIRAAEYRTNVSLSGDDYVELDLATSSSPRNYNQFQMNARGATNIRLDGGRATKREWEGEFLSKGRITSKGWEVEVRIPWALFRLPSSGARDMRFNVWRYMPRTSRSYAHIYTGKDVDAPLWVGVVPPAPKANRVVDLLPYGYAGYDADQGRILNAGLDVKTNLTNSIAFVGSINPDFRNVENQVLSLDFSRFARLAGESRPFFQEGADYLSSGIFASQLIPSFDVGMNTYGRLDAKSQFAFLNTNVIGSQEDLATEFGYTPDVNDSYRAAFSHLSQSGLENDAALLRFQHQYGYYRVALLDEQSEDSQAGHGQYDFGQIFYARSGNLALLNLVQATPSFLPRLGFQPEVDFKGPRFFLRGYSTFDRGPTEEKGWFLSGLTYRRVSGGFYRDDLRANSYIQFRNHLYLQGGITLDKFEDDHDHTLTFSASYPVSDQRHYASLTVVSGVLAEKPYTSASVNGVYYFGRRLSTTATYQAVNMGTDYEQQAIVGWNYDFGYDRSLSGRLIQQNGGTNMFVSFQQTGNRGTEYYLIFGDPNASEIDNPRYLVNVRTSVILKVVMPFQVGKSS